jgi:hypothetical protein
MLHAAPSPVIIDEVPKLEQSETYRTMPGKRRDPEDKLAELEERIRQIKEDAERRIARETEAAKLLRNEIAQRKRRADNRRKILVGAYCLAHTEHDPDFDRELWALLDRIVKKDRDRTDLGLAPLEAPEPELPGTEEPRNDEDTGADGSALPSPGDALCRAAGPEPSNQNVQPDRPASD